MASSALTQTAAAATGQSPASQKRGTARELIERHTDEFRRAIGDELKTQHFTRGVLTALTNTPQLQVCTESSLIGAVLLAAQLKLEIGMNQFWLTPRRVNLGKWDPEARQKVDDWQDVVVPIIGYQGYITLMWRSGLIADIQTVRVREGDYFDYGYTTERGIAIDWKPLLPIDVNKPYVGGIARSRTTTGGVLETYLHVDQVEQRRPADTKKANAFNPWTMNVGSYESMCDKTVLREHQKTAPKTIEIERALHFDSRVLRSTQDGDVDTALTFEQDFGPTAAAIEQGKAAPPAEEPPAEDADQADPGQPSDYDDAVLVNGQVRSKTHEAKAAKQQEQGEQR